MLKLKVNVLTDTSSKVLGSVLNHKLNVFLLVDVRKIDI